ncbi:MAG: RNA polymerase sigma factor, partial [Eubacterium sp.]
MRNLNHKELANLVILSQKGDADAFSELYALTYQGQFYAANQIMKDAYLAEDIIQEVYIRLYQTIERIEKPQGFLSYLNRMTYHACISYKRKRFYNSENSVDQDFLDSFQDYAMLPTPEKHTLSNERSQIVADALKQLSDESRCAILMRYSEDLKIKEIAEILDCSTSTVKRRINASKELLKAYLDEHKMRGFLFTPFLGSLLSLSKNASPLTEASAENILQNTLMTSGHPAPDGILKL